MIGITISLAGSAKINAINMTPSKPITRANGSKNSVHNSNKLVSPIMMLAIAQITIPAGAATAIARPKTNNVLSKTERIITLPICGRRYGGSSNAKEDGKPFNIVFDNILDTNNVIIMPNNITAVSNKEANID